MRGVAAIVVMAGFGCGVAAAEGVPLPRPRPPLTKPQPLPPPWAPRGEWREPVSFRDAVGPDFKADEVTSEPSACRVRLEKFTAIEAMPRLIGPGACGGGDVVRLDAVMAAGGKRIDIKPAPYLRCPMAEQLALWVRDDAVPQVAKSGAALAGIETYDDFDCRGRNRSKTGKVSEHGKANAVDVRGLTFADGRFAMLTDIKVDKALRESLRQSACERFTTVLGPGSDGYHEQHIHLDLAERHNGYRICHWEVREPPKPAKPPEKPKPAEADVAAEPQPAEADPKAADGGSGTPSASAVPEQTQAERISADVPLPRPRPAAASGVHHHRKTRRAGHFPFNLFR